MPTIILLDNSLAMSQNWKPMQTQAQPITKRDISNTIIKKLIEMILKNHPNEKIALVGGVRLFIFSFCPIEHPLQSIGFLFIHSRGRLRVHVGLGSIDCSAHRSKGWRLGSNRRGSQQGPLGGDRRNVRIFFRQRHLDNQHCRGRRPPQPLNTTPMRQVERQPQTLVRSLSRARSRVRPSTSFKRVRQRRFDGP